jgi:hypothetical protein
LFRIADPVAAGTPPLSRLNRRYSCSYSLYFRKIFNAAVAALEHDWPDWQIWVIHKAVGGTIWCARRWDDERNVLNADSADELTDLLEEEAGQ